MSTAAKPEPSERDQRSVAEARELIERAHKAFLEFQRFSQQQVDAIIDAMAAAARHNAEKLAQMAVDETGYGIVADKIKKNLFSAEHVYQAIRPMKTVGIVREDPQNGVLEVAAPVGVVAAVLPSTNPTSTAIYKILIALKARNSIVLSPHPSAMRCTCETTSLMREAAIKAGAPPDVICCFTTPSAAGTQELMRHRRTAVVLATGGMGIVRAAYSSGKPAFGVGPGNVPAFIDRSADIAKGVRDVVYGTSFDHGTICSSEQAIVAEESIRDQVIAELKKNGAYFLQPDEIGKLGREMVNLEAHTINPKYVGKSAKRIAELAGMSVPENTRVLIAQLEGVGRDYPLSAEKLSPVLALYFGKDRSACMDLCASLLRFGGLGHTCAIHATDEQVIREYGLRMPAFRVVVNSPAPQGSIGSSTNLFPAMTLGCGAIGGNITSDNIGPMHLLNLKRVAYEMRPVTGKEVVASLAPSQPVPDRAQPSAVACACTHEPVDASVDRVAVARAVERFVSRRTPAAAAPVPQPQPAGATTVPGTHAPKPRPVDFVSEVEIRQALRRREKIIVGRKTIITPAARDLAAEYDVLVVAD